VSIETYGPFFYSETETQFLTSINRLLLIAGLIHALLGAAISIPLSRSIAKPVLKAGEAARQIARVHSGGMNPEGLIIRIDDHYKTWELQELSRSINNLAEELEAGEQRQKQLSADIAHELRTPLTCLQGNIEAMIDGVYRPDREHLLSCHEEIIRLTNLVKDLSILTSLEGQNEDLSGENLRIPYGMSQNLHKTYFDLAKLLQAATDQFAAAAQEKGIAINLNLIESPINADYDRLKQVFINLLSNAVKYTETGSVTVQIEKGAPHWNITIADTGIGIPEEDIPHIFDRFYRTDKSRSRGTGGAGIGLTIAAAIVAAHEGKISVKSGGGSGFPGSVFLVQL
jgi:signal transduction histidine kinase